MNGEAIFRPQFTRIKDISNRRRLPRIGKIRLGVKAISVKTGKEYPKETDYFVCPLEVQKIYGERPKELEVMFPLNDLDSIFPQRLAWYGSSRGVKCMGDGERAIRIEEPYGTRYDAMIERSCPCELLESKACQRRAHLLLMLPKVNVGGIYQIDIGSLNSIIDINSGLDYVQAMVGRFSMVPLKLKRVPRETHGSGKKETHYTLMVFLEGDIQFVNTLRESTTRILAGPQYALPAPVMENPAMDEGAIIEVEEENEGIPNGQPTEEEVQKDLNDSGMIGEDKLHDFRTNICQCETKADLAKIFQEFIKDKTLSKTQLDEATNIANDRHKQLKKGERR